MFGSRANQTSSSDLELEPGTRLQGRSSIIQALSVFFFLSFFFLNLFSSSLIFGVKSKFQPGPWGAPHSRIHFLSKSPWPRLCLLPGSQDGHISGFVSTAPLRVELSALCRSSAQEASACGLLSVRSGLQLPGCKSRL